MFPADATTECLSCDWQQGRWLSDRLAKCKGLIIILLHLDMWEAVKDTLKTLCCVGIWKAWGTGAATLIRLWEEVGGNIREATVKLKDQNIKKIMVTNRKWNNKHAVGVFFLPSRLFDAEQEVGCEQGPEIRHLWDARCNLWFHVCTPKEPRWQGLDS